MFWTAAGIKYVIQFSKLTTTVNNAQTLLYAHNIYIDIKENMLSNILYCYIIAILPVRKYFLCFSLINVYYDTIINLCANATN